MMPMTTSMRANRPTISQNESNTNALTISTTRFPTSHPTFKLIMDKSSFQLYRVPRPKRQMFLPTIKTASSCKALRQCHLLHNKCQFNKWEYVKIDLKALKLEEIRSVITLHGHNLQSHNFQIKFKATLNQPVDIVIRIFYHLELNQPNKMVWVAPISINLKLSFHQKLKRDQELRVVEVKTMQVANTVPKFPKTRQQTFTFLQVSLPCQQRQLPWKQRF